MGKRSAFKFMYVAAAAGIVLAFQNCGQVSFNTNAKTDSAVDAQSTTDPDGPIDVCNGVSCTLNPLTNKPAVVTILMALGDEADSQLVVKGASSQLIAETMVRYASPKNDPKILLVLDRGRGSESTGDTVYVEDVLLKRYNVTRLEEPAHGLTAAQLNGYDLVWFNNPGAPMTDSRSRDALIAFAGGVILQGDDLSRGASFDNSALTGLTYIDNGTEVVCDGTKYPHDNNAGNRFRVSLDPALVNGASAAAISFEYGNDIDNTAVARPGLEIVAYALGGPSSCTERRPAIVRYQKN